MAESENFNGSGTLERLRLYGIADIQPSTDTGKWHIRMPRPLLGTLNEICNQPIWNRLLCATHNNWDVTQELVQLHSLVNTYIAYQMLDSPNTTPTLAELRPGATFFHGASEIKLGDDSADAAPTAVKVLTQIVGGKPTDGSRHWWPYCRELLGKLRGSASLAPTGSAAVDSWLVTNLLYLMQSKGQELKDLETLGEATSSAKEIETLFQAVERTHSDFCDGAKRGEEAAQVGSSAASQNDASAPRIAASGVKKQHQTTADDTSEAVRHHVSKTGFDAGRAFFEEYRVSGERINVGVMEIMTAHRVPNVADISLPKDDGVGRVLVDGSQLDAALGPVFAGIFEWSARVREEEKMKKEESVVDAPPAKKPK